MENTFDAITDKAKEIFGFVGKKTDEVVNLSKAKIKISTLNGKIKEAYERLGNTVYDSKKQGTSNDDLVNLIIREIDEMIVERDNLEKTAEQLGKDLTTMKDDSEIKAAGPSAVPFDGGATDNTASASGGYYAPPSAEPSPVADIKGDFESVDIADETKK